jgi:23S rRNA pseudouridine955/2504/2580 synthase
MRRCTVCAGSSTEICSNPWVCHPHNPIAINLPWTLICRVFVWARTHLRQIRSNRCAPIQFKARCLAGQAAQFTSNCRANLLTPLDYMSRTAEKTKPAAKFLEVSADYDGQRLDNFLLRELKGVPKSYVYRVVRSGEVRVNKGRASADTRLAVGDMVRIPPVRVAETASDAPAPALSFEVVFEDAALLIVNKPAGIAVHGGSGVSFGVIESLRKARPDLPFLELVHRLDRETSGLLMLAKKRSALLALQDDLRERATDKRYFALVMGAFEGAQKTVDAALIKLTNAAGERFVKVGTGEFAKPARTIFRVKERFLVEGEAFTLLEAKLLSGRTHQIRVHLQHLGLPIVGDPKYGNFELNRRLVKTGAWRGAPKFDRMFLHAAKLALTHPATHEPLLLDAPLPAVCESILRYLRECST